MITINDVLVNPGTAINVVRLDREHLLQRVGGAIRFQSPDFHLTESLATELRLTTQRLLGNEAVRTGRTRVHLVVHQVVQLQHVHVAYGYRTVELVTSTAIPQLHLARGIQTGQFQQVLDLVFLGAVEYRSCHRHAATQVASQLEDFSVAEALQVFLAQTDASAVVDLVEELANLGDLALLLQHLVDTLAQTFGCQAQMHFENLTDVHPRRYAERVQDDIDRNTVLVIGHVFLRHDHRDNTLVTVTASHLVARLHATLDGKIDLDHFQHAMSQIVAGRNLALLVLVTLLLVTLVVFQVLLGAFQLLGNVIFRRAQFKQFLRIKLGKQIRSQLGSTLETGTAIDLTAKQLLAQTLNNVLLENAVLVLQVLAELLQLGLIDLPGTIIFLDPITGKYLYVNDGALDARRYSQRSVLNIGRLLAEDGTQQLLFRSQLGLTFRRHLANQNVTGGNFSANINNARLVQLGQRRFTDIRDVGSDLLRPQLGVPRYAAQFLNVDGGEAIFFHHPLGNQDRVFEVVTVPGHEGDAHVLTQRQLTHVGGRAISQNVATGHLVTNFHQRPLIDAGVLVGPGVFGQVVDINTGLAFCDLAIVNLDDNA